MLSEGKAFLIFLKDSCNLSMWAIVVLVACFAYVFMNFKLLFPNHKYNTSSLVM